MVFFCLYRSYRKAFSNDPTSPLMESITLFESNIEKIKRNINQLKEIADGYASNAMTSNNSMLLHGDNRMAFHQHEKHIKLIIEYISKNVQNQLLSFKKTMSVYSQNMQERSQRVNKYGHNTNPKNYPTVGIGNANANHISGNGNSYAMFGNASMKRPPISRPPSSISRPLVTSTHRNNSNTGTNTVTADVGNAYTSGNNNGAVDAIHVEAPYDAYLSESLPDTGIGLSIRSRHGGGQQSHSQPGVDNQYYKPIISTPYNNVSSSTTTATVYQQAVNQHRLESSEQIEASIARVCILNKIVLHIFSYAIIDIY